MKNLLTKLRYVPKRFALVAALVVASSTAVLSFAWGPDRPTFTMESPAPYVTFNSITNNPLYGDEREFTMIKDLTTGAAIGDETTLVAGHEYQVQVYVHNDASDSLNESGVGVAKDTTLRATIPATVNGDAKLYGHVTASNAVPKEVYDSVALKSAGEVSLEYVSGSAKLVTQYQNVALGDELATTGVKVGDQDLSGNWRGCVNQSGVVTFKIRVKEQVTDFTMSKQVRKHSTTTGGWVENYVAQPGEKVDYLIQYRNTGNTSQANVIVKDTLPAGMTYVTGSTVLANGSQPNGAPAADTVTTTGLNIGTYAPNASAWVRFSATVAANDKLTSCGPNTLHNVASVTSEGGTKTDAADVTVTKTCAGKDNDIKVCDLTSKKEITIKESAFDATKHSKNLDDCKEAPVTETPEVIASTGTGAILSGLFGSSALGLGISSFVRSRGALRSALNR
jgi:uncharacterized repeat protein (TIGR01451 family)